MIRILVVDHDKNLRCFIAKTLSQQHSQLTVDQAASGNEAIQRMNSGEKFCFIISAYNMPNGNGLCSVEIILAEATVPQLCGPEAFGFKSFRKALIYLSAQHRWI